MAAAACAGGGDAGSDATVASAACDADNGGLVLPAGLCATVFADGLDRTRHMAVAANGVVYARASRDTLGGGIVALRDADGDGHAELNERFEASAGTGAAIHEGYLYFSTDTSVLRVALPTDGALVPTAAPETIVSGFPRQRGHAAKPFTFDGAGNLYVNVGGPSNACQAQDRQPGVPGENPCSQLPWRTRHSGPTRRSGPWPNRIVRPAGSDSSHPRGPTDPARTPICSCQARWSR
jgi:glucose/arabinose dehydrogenase